MGEEGYRTTADAVDEASKHVQQATLRSEWTKWIFAAGVTVAVAFFGWIGSRTVGVLDRTETTVSTLQRGMDSVQQLITFSEADMKRVREMLTDHETRIRQDRELLVDHNLRITNDAQRLLSLEQTRQEDERRILENTRKKP